MKVQILLYWRYYPVFFCYYNSTIENCKLQFDFSLRHKQSIFFHWTLFPKKMAVRKKRKFVAVNKENCEEYPRSELAQNSNVPRAQEDYITQVSGKIEGRVTKKLSQELGRTENRILGALAHLDDFLMNPLTQGHSGTTPEKSRKALSTNQGTNGDKSQSDFQPEAGIFGNQTMRNSGQEEQHDAIIYFCYFINTVRKSYWKAICSTNLYQVPTLICDVKNRLRSVK